MARHVCPVCGDPRPFMFWADPEPPPGCADDEDAMQGRARTIRNVTECQRQMKSAWQAAEFRKLVPDAFDDAGTMKPGQLVRVVTAFAERHPGKKLVI